MTSGLNLPQNINNTQVQPPVNPIYNAGVAPTVPQNATLPADMQTQGYYNPQQVYANNVMGYNAKPQSQPQASCSAVTIKIENPTVGGPSQVVQPAVQQYYPAYPSYIDNSQHIQGPVYQQPPQQPVVQQTPAAQPKEEPPKAETEEKKTKKEKEVTELTDEYIQTLENYLNNDNPEVRLMGAKQLLARFKEDKTRKNDAVLTNLLNKVLQDPKTTVRTIGMSILGADYADGNDETISILQTMQNSDKMFGQEALSASEMLLKLAGNQKIKIEDTDPPKEPKEAKEKASTSEEKGV